MNRQVEDHFKGEANILFKKFGSGEIENQYRRSEEYVLNKSPNADQLHIWNSTIYMLCSMLDESDLSDKEKISEWRWLVKFWKKGPPQHSSNESRGSESSLKKCYIIVSRSASGRSWRHKFCFYDIGTQQCRASHRYLQGNPPATKFKFYSCQEHEIDFKYFKSSGYWARFDLNIVGDLVEGTFKDINDTVGTLDGELIPE